MDLLFYVDLSSFNSTSQCNQVYEVYERIKAYYFFWTKEQPSKLLFEHGNSFK